MRIASPFIVWSAHIAVFQQNYRLSNAQLTIPLFTLALSAILSRPFVGRIFHSIDSSRGCRLRRLSGISDWSAERGIFVRRGGVRAALALVVMGGVVISLAEHGVTAEVA